MAILIPELTPSYPSSEASGGELDSRMQVLYYLAICGSSIASQTPYSAANKLDAARYGRGTGESVMTVKELTGSLEKVPHAVNIRDLLRTRLLRFCTATL
jgi:hypothetical protein